MEQQAVQNVVVILCPYCQSDEVSARTVTDMVGEDGSRSTKDICRCSACGRTFTVRTSGGRA